MVKINGTSVRNILNGFSTDDQIFGFGGNDDLFGKGGHDLLDGGTGADRMEGGTGNDIYVVDNTGDRVIEFSGQGIDTVRSFIDFTLPANVENLLLLGSARQGNGNGLNNVLTGNGLANVMFGLGGHDVLVGGLSSDELFGDDGNDTFIPGAGNGVFDRVVGGDGFDTVDYRDALAGVYVWLDGNVFQGDAFADRVVEVESVAGSRFDDSLRASNQPFSYAFGGAGNDRIIGSSANFDRLRGDDGFDSLNGVNGSAEDFWLQYNRGFDVVSNYRKTDSSGLVGGDDHIFIDHAEFGISHTGFLTANDFGSGIFQQVVQGVAPFTATRRLFYDYSTDILWADKDGSGSAFAPIPIAIFGTGSIGPTAADIFAF